MKIEIDTDRWVSSSAHAALRDTYFWFLAVRKAFAMIMPEIRRERANLKEEVAFCEAFAAVPPMVWDRLNGFTRGGKAVGEEEILSDPDYAHFVQCRDSAPKFDNRYH